MGVFLNKKGMELFQKYQEGLDNAQKNNELLATSINFLLDVDSKKNRPLVCEDLQMKAAYALNLCTVSVSQIIDYNDIFFLEREYEAILNNLNLEQMPKDEALLRILKQLLDVITYFLIDDKEKKVQEKEYQQKIKDAIWSAVPNFGVILAGGSPITMAVSLATQVGTGYMNYRKEKAKTDLEKTRKDWELQRSAMEQFNGLRRELFDTAWRLADEYAFPDEYRITERQIKQYNYILLDNDDMRRYERLEYIQDKFRAYPPFWCFLGRSAAAVYHNDSYNDSIRQEFKEKAINSFETFIKRTENNLLREDQLVASCSLEWFDLIDNKEKKLELLQTAKDSSSNTFDVLELCALSYLKIEEYAQACDLLRMLVNEDYNVEINAQLLSKLYAYQAIAANQDIWRQKYATLETRVLDKNIRLFPMPPGLPQGNEDPKYLEEVFLSQQKQELLSKYATTIGLFIEKYSNSYDCLCNSDGNISDEMVKLIKKMCKAVDYLLREEDTEEGIEFSALIREKVTNLDLGSKFGKMLEAGGRGKQENQIVSFESIVDKAFYQLAEEIISRVEKMTNMTHISIAMYNLDGFRETESLLEHEDSEYNSHEKNASSIEDRIFGSNFEDKRRIHKKTKDLLSVLTNEKYNEIELLKTGEYDVSTYLEKYEKHIKKIRDFDKHIVPNDNCLLAVIYDETPAGTDLIFTTEGVVALKRLLALTGSARLSIFAARYREIKTEKGKLTIRESTYSNDKINMELLDNMIKELASVSQEHLAKEGSRSSKQFASVIQEKIQNGSSGLSTYSERPMEIIWESSCYRTTPTASNKSS